MINWRHKKDTDPDSAEDFVLLRDDTEDNTGDGVSEEYNADEPESVYADDSQEDTGVIPLIDDSDLYGDTDNTDDEDTIQFDVSDDNVINLISDESDSFYAKYRSTIWTGGIIIAAGVLIAVIILLLSVFSNPLRNYNQVSVSKGNVVNSMNTGGTLSANARYSITSLVSGRITASKPEVGDKVTAGTVLYQLDDTEAQLAVKRAENQLARSKAVGSSNGTTSRIYAAESGTVQSLNIRIGSTVSAGQVIGTLKRADDTVVSIITSVSGTISAVSSGAGRSVTAGAVLATVTDAQTQANRSTSTYDQKSNEYDVESAKKQLEYYTIKSPVTGIVAEKNAKVGDNVGMTDTDSPMMVVVDMNSLKFTFQVDEQTVWNMEVGQSVIINTDSLPGESFAGEVTRVSSEGYKNNEDKTVFDVDVTIEDPGDLKSGMSVNAKVVLDSATNVLYLPKEALMEPDGKQALVIVKDAVTDDSDSNTALPPSNPDGGEENAFPDIKVPKGCRLVTVTYGIADDKNVQIKSGIKMGDIVVYDQKQQAPDFKAAAEKDSKDNKNSSENKDSSASDNNTNNADTLLPSDSTKKDNELSL